jgi:hypothetical protein
VNLTFDRLAELTAAEIRKKGIENNIRKASNDTGSTCVSR